MTYAQLALLLIQLGPRAFALAEMLVAKWNDPTPLTVEDVAAAKKLGERSPKDAMLEALIRAGVPLDSPQAVAMLALVPA